MLLVPERINCLSSNFSVEVLPGTLPPLCSQSPPYVLGDEGSFIARPPSCTRNKDVTVCWWKCLYEWGHLCFFFSRCVSKIGCSYTGTEHVLRWSGLHSTSVLETLSSCPVEHACLETFWLILDDGALIFLSYKLFPQENMQAGLVLMRSLWPWDWVQRI